MQTVTNTLETPAGHKLHTISWLPDTTPRANILLLHGIAEHSGRYAHVAEFLTARGYAIYSLDHQGHGKSTGIRADFNSLDALVDDASQYLQTLPQERLYVFGHSMGSLVAVLFALRHQDQLEGIITSGLPLDLATLPAPLVAVVRLLSKIAPTLPVLKLNADHITSDPAQRALYDSDPLNYRGAMRTRATVSLVDASRKIIENAAQLTLPALIMHGEEDTICPVAGSKTFYNLISASDKTLKIYPQMYHEIVNEIDKAQVLADLGAWLDAHTS